MNLKKIGSALTAVSMIASMATYVPFAASAETSTTPADTVYEYDIENTGVHFALNVTKNVLTLSPAGTNADAAYEIPASIIGDISYTFIGTNQQDAYDTKAEVAAEAETIVIKGDASIKTQDSKLKNTVKTTYIKADCRADIDGAEVTDDGLAAISDYGNTTGDEPTSAAPAGTSEAPAGTSEAPAGTSEAPAGTSEAPVETSDSPVETSDSPTTQSLRPVTFAAIVGSVTGEVTHEMTVNTTKHTHVCKYGDFVAATFDAHNFTAEVDEETGVAAATIDTKNNVHICECGKVDTDYLLTSDQVAAYEAGETNPGYEAAAAAVAQWNGIHPDDDDNHTCDLCKAELIYSHTKAIQSVDKDTHSVKCNNSKCARVLSTAENHTFAVPSANTLGVTTAIAGTACTKCDPEYKHATNEHTYDYAFMWKYDELGNLTKEFVQVGTEKGVYCVCGAMKAHEHTFVTANKHHTCYCGYDSEDSHTFNKYYDANGVLSDAAAGNAVICGLCGAVDENHTNHEVNHYDTTANKHLCRCGEEVASDPHVLEANKANNTHVCKLCEYVSVEHSYDYVAVVAGADDDKVNSKLVTPGKDADAVSTGTGYICECGAIKDHNCKYEYGVNPNHYCICGKAETPVEHVYKVNNTTGLTDNNDNYCDICGKVTDHAHQFNANCECTVEGCNETCHDYVVAAGQTKHVCQNCGKIVTQNDTTDPAHKFEVVNNKHVCECGLEAPDAYKGHKFGTEGEARHECQVEGCSFNMHYGVAIDKNGMDTVAGTPTVDTKTKTHTCTCGYVFSADEGHNYTVDTATVNGILTNTDKCTCGKINPDHVCNLIYSSDVNGTDKCRCGEEFAHDWIVDSANNQHECANKATVVTIDPTTGKQTAVEETNESLVGTHVAAQGHVYTNKASYCECGHVNETELFKNLMTSAEIAKLLGQYTSSYVVALLNAANNLYPYSDAKSETESHLDTVKTAKTDAEKAAFEGYLAVYEELYADKENNQAAGGANVFVATGDPGITLNAPVVADKNYRVVAGQFGTSIDLAEAISIKSGYTFAGWYLDAAGTKPASDDDSYKSANFNVVVGNGTVNYYAKSAVNTNTAIVGLPANINYQGTITATSGASIANATKKSFVVGEEVTLKLAQPDSTFLFLEDSLGNTHSISTSEGYTFKVTGNETFTAVTYNEDYSGDSVYVVYKMDDSDTARTYAYGDAPKVTSNVYNFQSVLDDANQGNPSKSGYVFKGWKAVNGNIDCSKLKTVTVNSLSSVVLIPDFEVVGGLKINLKGGRFALTSDAALNSASGDGFDAGTRVGLWAEEKNADGKYFSGWYVNGVLTWQTQEFFYTINEDGATVEAKYEGNEPLVVNSLITMSHTRAVSGDVQVVSINATRQIASGLTVVEAGIVYSSKGISDKDSLKIENVNGSTIKRVSQATDKRLGVFTADIRLKSAPTAEVNAVGYVIYQDANGNQQVIYSTTVENSTTADLNN